jgi:hypothetical protein
MRLDLALQQIGPEIRHLLAHLGAEGSPHLERRLGSHRKPPAVADHECELPF